MLESEETLKDIKIDKMCDLRRKDVEEHIDQLIKEVQSAKFICKKCARTASKKEYLCKSQKI